MIKYRKKDFFLSIISFFAHFSLYILCTKNSLSRHAKTQMSKLNTINHYDSNLYLSIQYCLCKVHPTYISPRVESAIMPDYFRNCSSFRKLELHFFNKLLKGECTCFICRKSWDLRTLRFSVLNKNESLRVLKSHFYFCLTWVLIISYFKLVNFSKYFDMLHEF